MNTLSRQDVVTSNPLSIRLNETLRTRLEHEAKSEDRSVSWMAQKAIEDFIAAREYKREIIANAYSGALTEKHFISSEKMNEWVESWGTENELPEPASDIVRT